VELMETLNRMAWSIAEVRGSLLLLEVELMETFVCDLPWLLLVIASIIGSGINGNFCSVNGEQLSRNQSLLLLEVELMETYPTHL